MLILQERISDSPTEVGRQIGGIGRQDHVRPGEVIQKPDWRMHRQKFALAVTRWDFNDDPCITLHQLGCDDRCHVLQVRCSHPSPSGPVVSEGSRRQADKLLEFSGSRVECRLKVCTIEISHSDLLPSASVQ